MLAGLWGLVGAGIYYAYQDALAEATDNTQILARVIDEHFQRTLETVDRALLAITVHVQANPRRWRRDDPTTRADMKQFIQSLPHVEAMVLFGPDGTPVNATRPLPDDYSAAARAFYDRHVAHPSPRPLISTPHVSEISGNRLLLISRRIDDRVGGFRGVLVAGLCIDNLIDFYGAITKGEYFLGLTDARGIILARYPDARIGEAAAPPDTFRDTTGNSPVTLHVTDPSRDEKIILSTRAVGDLGLYAYAATTVTHALAPVWRRGLIASAVAFVFSLAILHMAWLLHLHRKRLRAAIDRLSRTNAELERVAVVASHDLREPLRSVVGFSQLLDRRHRPALPAEAREMLDHVTTNAKRMDRLINDLLAYTGAAVAGDTMRPVDSARTLAVAEETVRTQFDQVEARVVIKTPLPLVQADEMQLFQLFCHLLRNAVKFRRPGVAPRIEVSARPHQGMWRFAIADNGIGISPEDEDDVFMLYKRLDPRVPNPGTGAGLAICKRVVERHGGRIWVHGQPGAGSTFYFTLPMVGGASGLTPTAESPTAQAEYAS